MYSFYGGRPGSAFVIARTFPSEEEMIAAFQGGSNYTDVHYDEHVLIDTVDKNDPTNGRIYRRGYNYANSKGGAILIGTIAGPAGAAPVLIPTSYIHIEGDQSTQPYYSRATKDGIVTSHAPGFIYFNNNEQIDYSVIQTQINAKREEGTLSEDELWQWVLNTYGLEIYLYFKPLLNNEKTITTEGALTKDNGGIVSGKQYKSISWKSASLTNEFGTETNAYVTFRVPYPVFDFYAQSVLQDKDSFQKNLIIENTNQTEINDEPASNYPFYHSFKLDIPTIHPINITDMPWEGIGRLVDGGITAPEEQVTPEGDEETPEENSDQEQSGDNTELNNKTTDPSAEDYVYNKRLTFTIPISAPASPLIRYIEINGKMSVNSLGITDYVDNDNFSTLQNREPVSYFSLNSSIIKNAIFFKTTATYEVPDLNDSSAIVFTSNNKIYTTRDIIKNDQTGEITFNDNAEIGVIQGISANSLGVTIDMYTNLKNSTVNKTDFVLIRFDNLSIRFYDENLTLIKETSTIDEEGQETITRSYASDYTRENEEEYDIYHNLNLSSNNLYDKLVAGI